MQTAGSKRSGVAYRYGKIMRKMLDDGKMLICPLCHRRIYKSDNLSIDHIVSLANGGVDRWKNMQATHRECNQKAGAKRPPAPCGWKEEL